MMKSMLYCLVFVQLAGSVSATVVQDLRCERLKDALGVDATKPGLTSDILIRLRRILDFS